ASDGTRQSPGTTFVSDTLTVVRTLTFVSIVTGALLSSASAFGQSADGGQQVFVARCASCHGSDGNGGELGPAITTRGPSRTDDDLRSLLRTGLPASGMPAFATLSADEVGNVIRYVRSLRPRSGSGPARKTVALSDGRSIAGLALNEGAND